METPANTLQWQRLIHEWRGDALTMIAGRYELQEKLGAGGMGTVYRGTDVQTNTTVAIKQLKPEVVSTELVERFQREGEALRELNHPNIVKMLDSFSHDGQHYLVMEYVSGGDLKALIEQVTIDHQRCVDMAIDLADALTRAHRLNIIHRDLKPANVLIGDDGTLRLTDFGVAHVGSKERVTDTDAIVGTIDYLPPEVFAGEGFDARGDIWAFGVMLFEMLSAQRPFTGKSIIETIHAITTQPVPDLEALCPDAPIALDDLIYRMLERDRNARISSVRHVGAALEDILHGREAKLPAPRFDTPTPDFTQRAKHNLSAQTTPFVGRERELSELDKLLSDTNVRLITVLAPGGMGKTRLVLQAAENALPQFEDGVYFVDLAPLSDHENIVPAVADALGYQFQSDGRTPRQQVLDFLSRKSTLLMMDNYEHLLDGAPLVTDILNAASKVNILVTSRQRLSQPGETLFHLSGMDFPAWETPEDALRYAAVKLFLNSAKRARPDFELTSDNLDFVAHICKLVQGMPLGIVLAASWLGMLSIEEVSDELRQGLDFLETDETELPERQRSIRAVMDYSWQRMTEAERQVFMKLSVFRGGFTREAAEAVAGATLRILMSLVNKSLIRRDAESGRYQIHELLRQYAHDQLLEENKNYETYNKHSDYFVNFINQFSTDDFGSQLYDRFDAEFENFQVAFQHCATFAKIDPFLDVIIGVWGEYMDARSRLPDAIAVLENTIASLSSIADNLAIKAGIGRLQSKLGWYSMVIAQPQKGIEYATQALDIANSLNDDEGIHQALQTLNGAYLRCAEFNKLLITSSDGANYFESISKPAWQAEQLVFTAMANQYLGDYQAAKKVGEKILELRQKDYDDWTLAEESIIVFGWTSQLMERFDEAIEYYHRALNAAQRIDLTWAIGMANLMLGSIAIKKERITEANDRCYRAFLAEYSRNFINIRPLLYLLPSLFILRGNTAFAVQLASYLHHNSPGLKAQLGDVVTLPFIEQAVQMLESIVDEKSYTAAWERGKSLDLQTVVQKLLDEFAPSEDENTADK